MSRVNIPSHIQDPNYRYKMPKLQLKQESRLNGVKTNIVNLDEVSKALRVPEEAIIKYWCAELGASKEKKTILKGQHNYETLLKTLDKFIEKYILCQKCKYPECAMNVKQKQLFSKCSACGNINQLDSMHRAGVQIMKQGQFINVEFNQKKDKKDQPEEAQGKPAKKGTEKAEEEKDEEGEQKPPLEEIEETDTIQLNSEEIESSIDRINQLALEQATTHEKILEELKKTGISFGFTNEFRYYILICGLFNNDRNIVKFWKDYEKIFLQLVQNDGKVGIKHLLQAIILFFVRKYPEMQKFAQTFMKLLYDQEIFSEDFIVKWYNRKQKLDKNCGLYDRKAEKLFRVAIETFVNWLMREEQDEEEESGEEEEEEEEVSTEVKSSPSKPSEQNEAIQRQKELIQKQMQEQQDLINAKKEEALRAAAERELENKVNVLDINVEEDFEIDDI